MHRLHPHPGNGGREPTRLSDHLAHEREPVAVQPRPRRIVRRGRQRAGDLRGVDHVPHLRRLGGRERAHVLREPPQLLVGQEFLVDQIGEGGHRRPVEAGAQPAVDVRGRRTATEPPALVEVGRVDREPGVILERRRGRSVAVPLVAMAFAAADGIVKQPPFLQGSGAGAPSRLLRERQRRDVLARVGEERREGLEVRHHVTPLAIREPALPGRHRAAGEPVVDRAHQVRVGRQLAARRGAHLVDRSGEVAGARQHRRRGGTVAGAGLAVTAGAPFHIDVLAGGGVLGG